MIHFRSLTALRQHALFCLLQLLCALCRVRLQHPLTCSHATSTCHTALAPVRPWRQHTGYGVYKHTTHTDTHRQVSTKETQMYGGPYMRKGRKGTFAKVCARMYRYIQIHKQKQEEIHLVTHRQES